MSTRSRFRLPLFRLCADESYEPVAANGLLFVSWNVGDDVAAYDLGNGVEKWCFISEGPCASRPSPAAIACGLLPMTDILAASMRSLGNWAGSYAARRMIGRINQLLVTKFETFSREFSLNVEELIWTSGEKPTIAD
ncbi:MAG: hypothetical protein NTU79_02350 [Planctomycetota bacterium]|nr:hypothetical protein [Planctomycetota bacterium]